MRRGIILSSYKPLINYSMNQSAGVFFYSSNTQRYLYLLRTDNKNPGNWGIPGGKIEEGETLFDGMIRECQEELGYFPTNPKLIPIQKFNNNTFTYHTFFCEVADEFVPILNEEHCGYAWVGDNQYPKPLHPGLFSTVNFDVVQDKLKTLTKKET
jgi:8-oxo-dGTP pyrophosphatase MutT (NUDIX family)